MFKLYYRRYTYNLTERENLRNSDCPFVFSLMIFVSDLFIITSINFLSIFTKLFSVLLLLLAGSLVPKFHFQIREV